jgi:2,4-dienoyl-CoA reductase-like NADH-dependent reductase (Old Yellow Enzyme family)
MKARFNQSEFSKLHFQRAKPAQPANRQPTEETNMTTRENSIVFKPGRIGNIELKNRLVRSATYENAANQDGTVSEKLIEIYRNLAQGGVGLIVTGIAGTYPKALAPHLMMGIYDDAFIPGLKKIPQAVKESDEDCKVMIQLHHPGRQVSDPEAASKVASYLPQAYLAYVERHPEIMEGQEEPAHKIEPVAPSAVFDSFFERTPPALTPAEIDDIIETYAEGIRRAREAGFDGVQLHAAHGWLLSSFLSPHTNQREDAYGGSTENRARIITDIYKRARKKVGDDYPVLINLNTTDFLSEGLKIEDALKVAMLLDKLGFAAIETSGGMWEALTRSQEDLGWPPVFLPESWTKINSIDKEAYFLPAAKAFKEKIDIPVILVGGIKSFSKIEEILESGGSDFVSMSRPLIRQPDLPNLWLSGTGKNTADCVSCNGCMPAGSEPLRCRAFQGS